MRYSASNGYGDNPFKIRRRERICFGHLEIIGAKACSGISIHCTLRGRALSPPDVVSKSECEASVLTADGQNAHPRGHCSEWLTGALLDRLAHHVYILEMNGESYRLQASRRRRSSPLAEAATGAASA
jgi:hypothetical protein